MSPFAVFFFFASRRWVWAVRFVTASPSRLLCPPLTPSPSPQHPNSVFSLAPTAFCAWFVFFSLHAVVLLEKKNGTGAPVTAVSLSVSISGSLSKDQLLLHSYVIAFRWMAVPLTVGGSQAVSHSFLLLNVSLGRWVKSSVTICLDVQLYSVSHRKVIVCLFDKGKWGNLSCCFFFSRFDFCVITHKPSIAGFLHLLYLPPYFICPRLPAEQPHRKYVCSAYKPFLCLRKVGSR